MAKVIGNGLTATFTLAGPVTVAIAVTSISIDGGERPQIDITAAADTKRSAVPGLRAVATGSVTGILQDSQIDDLEGQLAGCTAVTLVIATDQADCTTSETLLNSTVHITGFTVDASIDEAANVTVNFMLAAGDTIIPA
jgi:hypothetical protein